MEVCLLFSRFPKVLDKGDSVSPLLFIVFVEALNEMLIRVRALKLFKSLNARVGQCNEEITHLFFYR